MDNIDFKQTVDVTMRKIFDMKMKPGHEMRKALIDESEFLKTFYFLKGLRVYMVDMNSKKAEEVEFTKGKEVVYIGGNANMEYIIIVLKNGNIYALDNDQNIKHIKNFLMNTLYIDKGPNNTVSFDNVKLFASNNLDKIIIANDSIIAFWQKNEFAKKKKIKSNLEELNGTCYNISLENEKKTVLSEKILNNKNYYESLTATFNNNYFHGSYAKILYAILAPTEVPGSYQIILIDFLFKYDSMTKIKPNIINFEEMQNEYVKNIEKRVIYSFTSYSIDASRENLPFTKDKERLVLKFNLSGSSCAIVANSQHPFDSTLFIFQSETFRVNTQKIFSFYSKVRYREDEHKFIWVEDIDWICNDLFVVLLFSQGFFCIVNAEFQLIGILEVNNNYIDNVIEKIICPYYYQNPKLSHVDKLQVCSSKKRNDYFIINSANYSIVYRINFKSYESKILLHSMNEKFEDFLYVIKYYQMYYVENDNHGLFDKIHNYIVNWLKDLYNQEQDKAVPNETISQIFNIFVKFIRIFRSINMSHDTNLTILSYLIGISNDFFYYLINYREIWLAFFFVNICENYLLKNLVLKIQRNKLMDEQIQKNQVSYLAVNPYFSQNPSLRCYNKIVNKVFHSKMRLLIIFISLIEFRNNQGLTINVLHFVLAKLCLEKMKKNNLLDDIQLVVKSIIRNYKYLKNENTRVGNEEYVLNSLTINFRYELFNNYIINRQTREDIKFEFLNDFFPIEELQTFNELNEMYCRGDDELLINEYNYINNVGVVQKWVLFFTNFFYNFLFEDIKNYIINHLRQYMNQNKAAENISPEETNLSSLIYFNITFFMNAINNHLKYFLQFIALKADNSNDYTIVNENDSCLDVFSNICMPFISPLDVPFIIFEFYIAEDNRNKKSLPHEINKHLSDKIQQYMKFYNFNLMETFDLIEFLNSNGFKYYDEEMRENLFFPHRIQNYIFTTLLFYIFNIHKFSQIHMLETDINLLMNTIDNLDVKLKVDSYEILYIILNGLLKYYLKQESLSKLSPTKAKYLEIVLNTIKLIFYKIVREEPFLIRKNIYEYVSISPSLMRPYLTEGALFYEYKNLNRYIKKKLYDNKNILNASYYDGNKKMNNIIEDITREDSPVFNYIFNTAEEEMKSFHENFSHSIKNLLLLLKIHNDKKNQLIFNIDNHRDQIKKIIINIVNEKIRDKLDATMFNELLLINIDKIVIGNFDNKYFKFSNSELRSKLVRSIKTIIVKFLHLMNIMLVKYKLFTSINPTTDLLNYLKQLSYCMIYERDRKLAYDSCLQIIEYLMGLKISDNKSIIFEIYNNLSFCLITLSKSNKLEKLTDKLKKDFDDRDIASRLKSHLEEIETLKLIWTNLDVIKSENLKMFSFSLFNPNYFENIFNVYIHIDSYVNNQQIITPLRSAKKKYLKLCESYQNITGIPIKSFIDFISNWDLKDCEALHYFIVGEENNNDDDKFKPDKQVILMNRRQKLGTDTPRKKAQIVLDHNLMVNNFTDKLDTNTSFSRKDSNQSIDLREEMERLECPKLSINIKTKNKKNKNSLPKYKKISKDIESEKQNTGNDNIIILYTSLMRLFFNKIKSYSFHKFKQQTMTRELEQIKVYNIRQKEGVEIIVLQEKYISNEEHKERREKIENSILNEEKEKIKPFDVININRFKSGKGDNSGIFKELMKTKNNKINVTIKNKLEELQEKLKKCEDLAKNLGKEFTSTTNK